MPDKVISKQSGHFNDPETWTIEPVAKLTRAEFAQMRNESVKDIYGHIDLPMFGQDEATLDGTFSAAELRQIADAIEKLQKAWEQVDDKQSDWIE